MIFLLLFLILAGLNAAAEYTHAETLLTRGTALAKSVVTTGTYDTDILCQGASVLVVQVQMTGAAAGDLTTSLFPFESDNATVAPISIPPMNSVGPTLNGGKVYYYAEYDVNALEKARLRVTNNNAGTQTIDRLSWHLA